ncbi:MAG: FAD-dependent oxidoreductase [Prochlorothrix sp.]|nr:FAD-dependent oxidoreductase [Prochlorothrix sp.]
MDPLTAPPTVTTEVLVVGGGTGGTAAALQAARRGAKTLLVSEGPWLGGMLTSAGVVAPDGNELQSLQTGIWGAFVRALERQQPGGLDHAWVSFWTYEPAIGAEIFAQWVAQEANLTWIIGGAPLAVGRSGDRLTHVRFAPFQVEAQMILDGTELGDLLALGDVPHRWGWEPQEQWQEPSAPPAAQLDPATPTLPYSRYPLQVPTWVVFLQDYGAGASAPAIAPPPNWDGGACFEGAWAKHGTEAFLNYGRIGGDRFMINWPIRGNDYGEGLERLRGDAIDRRAFLQEARWHSQGFAHWIQKQLGPRYGLAPATFPTLPPGLGDHLGLSGAGTLGGGAYALHPYYREGRRLRGQVTVREQDLLPDPHTQTAPLPRDATGQITAIALGNYPNDHHYPSGDIALAPKSCRWGGRWTGTPFALPYGCLVPEDVAGLLVCEKNISVSHMANGATRLQPLVLGVGQAAGMAAALCIERQCQPQDLPVAVLQDALLTDPTAPVALLPSFTCTPHHPQWLTHQRQGLQSSPASIDAASIDSPDRAPGLDPAPASRLPKTSQPRLTLTGTLTVQGSQDYRFTPHPPEPQLPADLALVTLCPQINAQLLMLRSGQRLTITGALNRSESWFRADALSLP